MNELWLQEQVAMKRIIVNKLKNKFNAADLLTKHLTKYEADQIIDFLQHEFSEGRNADAPNLSIITEDNFIHDDELHMVLEDGISQRCWCTGKARIQ